MNERRNNRKNLRDPLKKLDAQAYRRAFGEPDADFHERVRDTLFLIKEKEDEPVKKKMTFSMAFALVMCVFLAAVAFAGSLLPNNLPDNTFDPLSQSQNTSAPQPTPMPAASDPLYYRSGDMGFYHKLTKCFSGEQDIPTTEYDIKRLYLTACPYCVFDTVYCMEGSKLYHKTADCTAFGEHDLTEMSFDKARSEAMHECPICIASNCIFWQEGDEYTTYHLRICTELESIPDHSAAVQGTVAEARACGRELCETCKNSAVLYSPNQRSISHLDEDCINEENAEWIPLDSALRKDAYLCLACMEDMYFCTPWNGFYHRDFSCSALVNDSLMILSEEDAVSSGRTLCPDCNIRFTPPPTIPNKVLPTATPMPAAPTILSMPTVSPNTVADGSDTVTVYVDDGGSYYHTDYKCSGMTNPKKWQYYSVAEALNMGRTACSVCLHFSRPYPTLMPTATPIAFEPRTVYFVENGGIHYHTDYACSGMKNPQMGSVAQALNLGKTACPVCMDVSPTPTPMPTATPIASEPRTVYFTENGDYYHTDSTCLGMKNAQLGSVAQALNLGKTACPVCMDVSPTPMPMEDSALVYMTDYNGIYYHYDENCMNMVGAYYTTFGSMRNGDNRPPCPLCVFNAADTPEYVWSAVGDNYYHIDQYCGAQGIHRVTFAIAQNRRQTACPTCTSVQQKDIYYYRSGGTFFHVDKGCATIQNCEVSSGRLAQVQAMGRTPCPNCYEPSSNDITYYAAPNAYSYHTQFDCASAAEYHASGNRIDRAESAIGFEKIFDPLSSLHLLPCPDCVLAEPVAASTSAQSIDPRVPLMRNEAMEAPEGAPRSIVVNALDFGTGSLGSCMDAGIDWNCDVLTVHSTIMMHSRGAIYTEFEFTLKDASVDPDSIRLIPYCEESGSLGCLWANVQEIRYDNGETGYLLCQTMASPSLEYGADSFRLYVGEQMMAEFK